jgi:hypothetical protein
MRRRGKVSRFVIGKKKHADTPYHHPFIAIDTETDPDTGELVCACLYGEYKNSRHRGGLTMVNETFKNKQSLQDFLMSFKTGKNIPFKLIGFNMGYDIYYLDEIIKESETIENQKGIIVSKLKNGIPVWDVTNICSSDYPLEDWIGWYKFEETHGVKKIKTTCPQCGEETVEFRNCPKCSAKLKWTQERIELRCKMDTKATWLLINTLEDFFVNHCKIPLSVTIGVMALNLWQYHFTDKVFVRDGKPIPLEREAGRGGRTEVFRRGKQHTFRYDIHLTYTTALRDNIYPDPTTYEIHIGSSGFKQHWKDKKLMVVKATVYIPPQFIAPLPYRHPKLKKLVFPIGLFTGTWCSPELHEAVENYGAIILKIHEYIIYHKGGYWFRDFANYCIEEAYKFKQQGNIGGYKMMKRVGNSLWGKFGQSNGSPIKWIKRNEYKDSQGKLLPIEGLEVKKKGDILYIYVDDSTKPKYETIHSFPVLAAFVISYSRMRMLEALKKYKDIIVYTDTDSMHVLEPIVPTSPDAGEFGYEGEGTQDYYRAKFYGDTHKGVSKRAKIIYEDDKVKIFEWERPIRRNEAIRYNKIQNQWVKVKKSLKKEDDKREDIGGGMTDPLTVWEKWNDESLFWEEYID